jgi:peroxiredoxin Q/BCP
MKISPVLLLCGVFLFAGSRCPADPAAAPNPPDFTVPAVVGGGHFTLSEAKGKYVAVHFLLKTECPYCLRHTADYEAKASSLPGVRQIFLKPDSEAEIKTWTSHLPAATQASLPLYRDAGAALAVAYHIPDGYAFHGQTVHYPATLLLGPDGKEVFRYVGKNNGDRLSFEKLTAKVSELKATK